MCRKRNKGREIMMVLTLSLSIFLFRFRIYILCVQSGMQLGEDIKQSCDCL